MYTCENCKVGVMREPPDQHPAYTQCDSCMAIQLTYIPMEYQEDMHTFKSGGDIDIIAVFGGEKSHSLQIKNTGQIR